MKNSEFKKAIESAVIENDLAKDFTVDLNYSVVVSGREKYQVVSEYEIDEFCTDRKDYHGFPCASFIFGETEYFFVTQ